MKTKISIIALAICGCLVAVQGSLAQSRTITLQDGRIPLNDPLLTGEAGLIYGPRDVTLVPGPAGPDPAPVQWPAAVAAVSAAVVAATQLAHHAKESFLPSPYATGNPHVLDVGSNVVFDQPLNR